MRTLMVSCVALLAGLGAAWRACGPPDRLPGAAAQAPVDTGRVIVEGSSLFYEAAGRGAPVILLHAAYVDRRMWDDQFTELSRNFRVIRYDARGYGRSGPVTGGFERASDLHALLRALGVRRATLVGCSLGGGTAIDFALRHPDMVDRLVLVGSGVSGYAWPPDDMQAAGPVAARAALARGDTVGVARAWLLTDYLAAAREHPRVAAKLDTLLAENVAYWKGLLRDGDLERDPTPPALGRLGAIAAPTLVVVGSRDVTDIRHIADSLRAKLARARLVVFEGADHVPNMEQPARFTRLIREFLAEPPADP
jgi:pimeloyl-ACP methyl ester carboxylesterase